MSDNRKSQLDFEINNNTQAGADSVVQTVEGMASKVSAAASKAADGVEGIGGAGIEAAEKMDRATASIATSIRRNISDTQRQIAGLRSELSGGNQDSMFDNLIGQRGADAEKLRPLVDSLRTVRTELGLLQRAEQDAASTRLFQQREADAGRIREQAQAVKFWTAEIEKMEAAERRAAGQDSFVKSLRAQSEAIGKTRADLLELQAAQMGVSQQAAPYIARLREQETELTRGSKALNAYGQSAKQVSANLRGVPAQITDIVVSLQGGQAPLTVLLQQGGQLRDMFNGTVPAIKALGGAVLGLVNPFTLSIVAAGALTLAYYQGSKEADEYRKSLVNSGNAAGTTAAQMQSAAAAVSQSVGTQGAAAEVLAQLAATGQVAGKNMANFAEVTLKAERDIGIATKDTVKNFAALGESPVEASAKLNKEFRYLTGVIYDQIRALQDQGKVTEAGELAQRTYARAMESRSAALRGQLGSIESAWQSVTSAAKKGWDAILNVGRPTDMGEALKTAQTQLAAARKERETARGDTATGALDKGIAVLEKRIELMTSAGRLEAQNAEVERQAALRSDAQIRVSNLVADARSKELKLQIDINRLQEEKNQGLITEEQRVAAVNALRAKAAGDGKGDARAAQARQAELADLRAKIAAEVDYTKRLQEQGIQAEKNTAGVKLADSIQEQLNGKLDKATRAHLETKLELAKQLDVAAQVRGDEEQRAKAIAKNEEALRKQTQAVYDDATALEQQRLKLDETTEAYGKSAVAVAQLAAERTKLRLNEAEGSSGFDPAYVENLRRLLAEQTKMVGSLQTAEYDKVNRSLDEKLAKSRDQNVLLEEEISLIGLSEVERKRIVAAREVELKLAKELRDIEQSSLNDDQKTAAKIKAREVNRIEAANAANKVIVDDWTKTADQINQSLTDALLRGFESGKDFATNLRDTVVNMFKTMVLRPVISAILAPISGGISSLVSGVSGGIGGGTGIGGLISNVQSLYSGYSGLTSGQGVLGSIGSWLGLGPAAGTGLTTGAGGLGLSTGAGGLGLQAPASFGTVGGGAAGSGAMAAGGAFAAVAAVVLNALGAFKSERKIGGGLMGTLGSGDISPWEEWREGGTLFSGPSFSTMNPVAELERQRSRLEELRASGNGNTVQASATQMVINNLEEQYGGLAAATAAQSKIIQTAYDAMRDSAVSMAEALGLSSDKARDFTTQLGGEKGLNFDGLKPEEQQAKLAEALATANNEIAQQLIGTWETTTREVSRIVSENIGSAGEDMSVVYDTLTDSITQTRYVASEYAKDGEKAIDTLTRLASSLGTVNTIWDQLGNTLMEASLAGADAASRIVEAFGGLEAMSATTGSYFQNFYGADEQREAMRRQLQEQLGKLNLQLPDIDASNAREQYRQLAEAQDRNTEEGLKAYVALLQLSGAFAGLTEAAKDATTSMEKERESYYSALQRAVAAEKKLIQGQLDSARDVADALRGIFDLLHENIRDLRGTVEGSRNSQAQRGNEFINQALIVAKKSGYLPDEKQLAEAIADARGGLDRGSFSSTAERDYAALVLAGKLEGLKTVAGKQLTDAERTVLVLERQSSQLDDTLDYWRKQIDIANGTYEGVLSVEEAIRELIGSMNGTSDDETSGGGRNGGTPSAGGGTGWKRTSYGADEALESFDKFKAWYNGLRGTANTAALTDQGYDVPDWLRLAGMSGDGTDQGMFGQYQFFKNNQQYAKDYEQIMTTGRSSYGTDGKTLIRSDLSKMPADAAEYYKNNTAALLMAEGFLLDPVLAYQLYRDGPEKFGIDRSKISFTEWLRSSQWSEEGVMPGDGADRYSKMDYANYNLTKRDSKSGNIVGRDGIIYTSEGKPVGTATNEQMMLLYGMPAPNKPGRDLTGLRQTFDQDINNGRTGQELADKIKAIGASMSDVAAAYGISVDVLKENLRIAGATDIPAYRLGTNYVPEDGPAWLHRGEAVVPEVYNPAANPGLTGGGSRLEALFAQMLAELAIIKAASGSTATSTAATATVLSAVRRGNALIVTNQPAINP